MRRAKKGNRNYSKQISYLGTTLPIRERGKESDFMKLNCSCRYVEMKGPMYIVKEITRRCLKTFKTWTLNG